jgi:hypothetical protein
MFFSVQTPWRLFSEKLASTNQSTPRLNPKEQNHNWQSWSFTFEKEWWRHMRAFWSIWSHAILFYFSLVLCKALLSVNLTCLLYVVLKIDLYHVLLEGFNKHLHFINILNTLTDFDETRCMTSIVSVLSCVSSIEFNFYFRPIFLSEISIPCVLLFRL